jgi:hypothetical protein
VGNTYISEANVLDQSGINVGSGIDLLEQLGDHGIYSGVLESALSALGERGSDGEGDDDIVGVLLSAVVVVSLCSS